MANTLPSQTPPTLKPSPSLKLSPIAINMVTTTPHSGHKKPKDAKAKKLKTLKRVLAEAATRTLFRDEKSVFDGMNESQRTAAFHYYYDHPEQLPDRESGAIRKATDKPLKIRVKFDEGIFERTACLRPIPRGELEGVDPLVIDLTLDEESGGEGSEGEMSVLEWVR